MKQICNKCHAEKPLVDFHRRGAGYQKICKLCRKQARGSRIVSQEKQTEQAQNNDFSADRLLKLEKRIRGIVNSRVGGSDAFTSDDLFQDAILSILQSCPDLSDGMLLGKAVFSVLNSRDRRSTYNHYIDGFCMDDEVSTFSPHSVEDEIIRREDERMILELIETLSPENREIVAFLAGGSSYADIAREKKTSRAAVTQRMQTIKKQLSPLSSLSSVLGELDQRHKVIYAAQE